MTAITIESFLAWVESKDPELEYEYCDNRACPVAMFLRETGTAPEAYVIPAGWYESETAFALDVTNGFNNKNPFSEEIESAVNGPRGEYRTFGALAQRLR